jgi:hypothetical protein
LGQSARFTSIFFAEGKFFPNCHNSFIIMPADHEFSAIFDPPSRKRRAIDTRASSSPRRPAARRRGRRRLSRFESVWLEGRIDAPRGGGEPILALQSRARDGSLTSAELSLASGADR